MATKKITFHIENDEEEERVTISIKGIGKVILAVTFPEYEFLEDIGEDGLEELNVEEGDLIGKIEHLEINDEYKGQGYAKILMNKAIELAKEKGLMPLYLNASPMGSKRYGLDVDDLTGFYESLGFEVFLRQGGNNLMILKDTYKTGGETKNKIMAKQIKIQFEDNYANGGVTYIEWSKDNVWQEQFNDWKEDGNVSKNADGTYSTQDAQYTNSLKGISGLKKYFYNEFIKGQYAEGGTTDNNHLIAKAIEFIIGTAIDKDSIEIEPTEISYKRKNINVYSSLNKKLINDTILMHRKSLEGRYAEGGSVTYDIVWQDKYGEEYSEGFDTIEEVNELINNIKKNGGRIIEKAKYIDNNFKGYFAEGGSVGKGYSVFNYTDNIYATDEVFKTKKLANDFIKQFRNRFSKQGYYRDNQMNKIDIEDIDLLAIPSDFNPFGKYEDGGEMQEEKFRYKDFYQSQGGIKFKTEEEAERFIKTTKPFVRKQLREGNFVLVFNGKEYFIGEKIKINDEYADGGEVMVNGLTKQDFIDAFQNRVEKLIQELKKEGTYDENTFDFLYEIVEKDRDGGFTDIEETGFWLSSQDVDGYDKLAYYLSFDKNVGYRNYTDKVLSHFYFGKPMKIEFVLNTGGDTELGLEDELQKIKLLLNKIDFNKVVGSIDYDKTKNNTDLDFYKDVELVMSLNGDWNETTEELDTTIDFNDETAELNYHPLDTMGGLDLTQLEENINEAFRELNTYSAVVSIEGYEEYAEDVEGLENAKALMQDIKGNTRFQVLKGSSVGIGKRVDDSRVIEEFARGGETKTPKKYIVKGYVYDGGEIWKETFDNIDEAYELAYQIQNGWTDDGTYRLITIYDEKGKKVATISDDKYFNELTEHKLFKKVYLGADTKKERQVENEKLKGYKFNLQIRIADGGATGIFEKTFDSIFEVMDKMNTYYEEDYYARINDESLDYWEDKYSEIDLSRNYIKGKYGWSFIKENGYWIAKGDYDENHIVRLEKGKPVADSSITKGALKQIMELEAQKKYSEKPKHNKSLSDMKKIWDKLSNNYKEREDIAFLIGRYGGLLSDIVPNKWNDLDKSIQIQIMNAYFGKTEEEKQKIINQTRKHHEALVKKHKTLRNLYGKKYADGGRTMENRAKKQARKDIKTHLYRPQAPYQSVEKPSEEWERYELPYDTKMQYDFEPDSFSAEDKRYSEYAKGGEAGFDSEGTSMVLYHEKKGNWLVPKGQVYLYLYDVEGSGSKLGKEFDWVFYPLTAPIMAFQSGYIPPLKKIWTKKFQKDHKGSEHLLGVIKSYLIEEDGKKELFIDMMSVNPTKKKKGIMSYMIKELRESFNLSQDQVTFSDLTDEGKKFVEKKTYADGGEAESMNFFVVNNENDKYYNWVGYNVDETITDKQGNEFEKLYFENKKLPKKYNVNDLIYLEQRDTFTQKDKYGGSDTEYVILVNYQYSSKPFDFYYYLYNVTKKFVATEGNLDWVKSNLPRGWKFYSSYADGGETSGLITDEQVKDLSFKIKIKNVPLKKGVLLHEIVTLEEFDLPDEENINFYPFHLIYGDSSLAIFDAFGVDEVAGLKRKDCEEFINNLKAQGKTEKDGSFIAGLTNYVGDKLFMFFNVARLSYEGFANRVLPHEALHLSRSLISLYKNDWVRENLNTPKWWEDKRAVFVDMGDSNEEFFAETLERTTAIAMDGWYRVTGQKCVVEKNKTYADGGKIGKLKVLQKIVYESIKNKPSKSITTYNLPSDTRKILEELYYMDLLDRNYINGTQEAEYTLKYANGGDVPHEDKMFQLPLEMVVYVPSTQDVDKVISVDKMVTRVDEVKEYLASKFGGYTSADKLGGFVDSTGNLVNEDVVQVTAFATKEAYAQYKEELIHQLALWGKKWGQEAIGFEFEGDLMYVPQEL